MNQIVTNNDNYSSDDDTLTPIRFQRRHFDLQNDNDDTTCVNNQESERIENNPFISLQRFLDSNEDDEKDETETAGINFDSADDYRMGLFIPTSTHTRTISVTSKENKSFETRNSNDETIINDDRYKSMYHHDRHSSVIIQKKKSRHDNSNNNHNDSNSDSNHYEIIQMKRLKQQEQQQKQRRQRLQKQQQQQHQKSSNITLVSVDSNSNSTFGKMKSIQHHYNIRDNFSSFSTTTNNTNNNQSSFLQQSKKEGMKLHNAIQTSSSKPTNHKLHKCTLLDNSSFLLRNQHNQTTRKQDTVSTATSSSSSASASASASASTLLNSAAMWPRWNKEKKQQSQNGITNNTKNDTTCHIESCNDENTKNIDTSSYSFGPQFLSNRKRKHTKLNKNEDIIVIVDDNDNQSNNDNNYNNVKDHEHLPFVSSSLSSSSGITMTPKRNNNHSPYPLPSSTGSEYYYNGIYSNSPYLKSKRHRTGTYTSSSTNTATNNILTSTRRRRKKVPGTLSQLLQTIRKSIESDLVRFQSSHYLQHHYHRDVGEVRGNTDNIMDFNNPRNRAETIVDVTIIGGNVVPFATGSNKVIILGHVHSFIKKNKNNTTASMENKYLPTNAWLCFNPQTIKEHGIHSGRQLRIYDAMLLVNYDGMSLPLWRLPVILCSSLCESCPKQLSID
jgi:hypothetical protein